MRKRLTYANVAATLALVLSMSGGALAASHYLVSSTKQISPKVLKKLKGATGKAGTTGKEGPAGKEGAQGKEGKEGKEGKAGSAVGYAHVEASGEVVAADSLNVTSANIAHESAGVYCFHGLPFTVRAVVVSPDGFGPNDEILVSPSHGGSGCSSEGLQLRVHTTLVKAPGTTADEPFFIVFE
jgi:hypothetical protein